MSKDTALVRVSVRVGARDRVRVGVGVRGSYNTNLVARRARAGVAHRPDKG